MAEMPDFNALADLAAFVDIGRGVYKVFFIAHGAEMGAKIGKSGGAGTQIVRMVWGLLFVVYRCFSATSKTKRSQPVKSCVIIIIIKISVPGFAQGTQGSQGRKDSFGRTGVRTQ
jgi:hypothetical protein